MTCSWWQANVLAKNNVKTVKIKQQTEDLLKVVETADGAVRAGETEVSGKGMQSGELVVSEPLSPQEHLPVLDGEQKVRTPAEAHMQGLKCLYSFW